MLTLDKFKEYLKDYPESDIVQLFIFDNIPYCFSDNIQLYKRFRLRVCDKLSIHQQDFAIVGSAKTGFSLNPDNFGAPFNSSSDIDIVLISHDMFEKVWFDLLEYRKNTKFRLSPFHKHRFNEMQNILFYGLIRMDKISNDFSFAKEWWEYFNELSTDKKYGPRRIRAAIFKSWKHASYYYEYGIKKLKEKI